MGPNLLMALIVMSRRRVPGPEIILKALRVTSAWGGGQNKETTQSKRISKDLPRQGSSHNLPFKMITGPRAWAGTESGDWAQNQSFKAFS